MFVGTPAFAAGARPAAVLTPPAPPGFPLGPPPGPPPMYIGAQPQPFLGPPRPQFQVFQQPQQQYPMMMPPQQMHPQFPPGFAPQYPPVQAFALHVPRPSFAPYGGGTPPYGGGAPGGMQPFHAPPLQQQQPFPAFYGAPPSGPALRPLPPSVAGIPSYATAPIQPPPYRDREHEGVSREQYSQRGPRAEPSQAPHPHSLVQPQPTGVGGASGGPPQARTTAPAVFSEITVWIGKLPADLEDLPARELALAAAAGTGCLAKWKRASDPDTGKLKPYGFATYTSVAAASRALRLLQGVRLGPVDAAAGSEGVAVKVDAAVAARIAAFEAEHGLGVGAQHAGDAGEGAQGGDPRTGDAATGAAEEGADAAMAGAAPQTAPPAPAPERQEGDALAAAADPLRRELLAEEELCRKAVAAVTEAAAHPRGTATRGSHGAPGAGASSGGGASRDVPAGGSASSAAAPARRQGDAAGAGGGEAPPDATSVSVPAGFATLASAGISVGPTAISSELERFRAAQVRREAERAREEAERLEREVERLREAARRREAGAGSGGAYPSGAGEWEEGEDRPSASDSAQQQFGSRDYFVQRGAAARPRSRSRSRSRSPSRGHHSRGSSRRSASREPYAALEAHRSVSGYAPQQGYVAASAVHELLRGAMAPDQASWGRSAPSFEPAAAAQQFSGKAAAAVGEFGRRSSGQARPCARPETDSRFLDDDDDEEEEEGGKAAAAPLRAGVAQQAVPAVLPVVSSVPSNSGTADPATDASAADSAAAAAAAGSLSAAAGTPPVAVPASGALDAQPPASAAGPPSLTGAADVLQMQQQQQRRQPAPESIDWVALLDTAGSAQALRTWLGQQLCELLGEADEGLLEFVLAQLHVADPAAQLHLPPGNPAAAGDDGGTGAAAMRLASAAFTKSHRAALVQELREVLEDDAATLIDRLWAKGAELQLALAAATGRGYL